MVASFPHFHLADEKYVDAIKGISPQREHHQTFLDLNPVSLACLLNETRMSAMRRPPSGRPPIVQSHFVNIYHLCLQTTGVIVRANKRAQVNILLGRIPGFP